MIKLKKYQSDEFVTYYDSDEVVTLPELYEKRPNDVRGVWVSNVANIDTPIMKEKTEYQEYLQKMMENIASYNINTVVFQVRPANDAYYPSKLNPYSRFITGVEGKDPGFDVLDYVINLAKKYNIKIHAWINPYRVSVRSLTNDNLTVEEYLATLDDLNFAKRNPHLTIQDSSGKLILRPAAPEVIDFVAQTIMEIVENYDVEAVHIDDYFYPYAKIDEALEQEDYDKYALPNESFADFRRRNVDNMIKRIYDDLKEFFVKTGRKVLFGISPFSVYRTNKKYKETGWEKGSRHSGGALECYTDLYSDIYKWMKEGWIDYVVPQAYFPFERKDITYHDIVRWWSEISKTTNTTLYIGQGLYQMGAKDKPEWSSPNEIANQLKYNQNFDNIEGTIFFTYHDLVKSDNEIKNQALETIRDLWK
ncbi:MAG: glycoside hydrolase family 10 protein [Bacilli bacterium]|jgi:uncharacterized lipoprotein YddW (UPF0748 family)|nr:family 10 glycosylhydrolase [Acholeplasmataceae bacterium]